MRSTSKTLPPPINGWDTRTALSDMPPDHAIVLDNWFPETDRVTVRRGNTSHATGMSGAVETLIEYVPLTASGKMFAANDGNIYDVTSPGAVGAAVVTGMSSDRWQQVQIGTAAGQYVRLFNGLDTPQVYDGSTWGTTPAITGPTAASLVWGNVHQKRLWFGEKDSLSAWYLAVNSVGGAATEFPLAGIARLGGYLVGMGTWTRDAGDGMDDVAVFLTSEGEAIVYQGTDPASASAWSLVGVFRIGKPIGRRCFVKAGADLILVTQDGFVPLAAILTLDRSQARLAAISDQINRAVNDAVRDYGALFGWEPIVYPRGRMLVFNIPQSTTTAHQYVFNTITGAPCRFTGINAKCFALLNDSAYWGGSDGVVYKFDDGVSDDGANIEADALQAFNYFGSPQSNKVFKLVEPIFQSDGAAAPAIDLNTDFNITTPTGVATAPTVASGLWNVMKWNQGIWGGDDQIYRGWHGVRGTGRAAAIRIRVNTNSPRPSWISTNFTFVRGGQL